jgi:hypothetical protein
VPLSTENEKRKRGFGMGQFVVGIFTGIVMCMVAMLVRCVLWYEKKHPEDDYWRRLAPPGAHDAQDKGGG